MIKGNLSVVQDELNFPSPSFPRPTLSLSLSRFLLSPTHVTHAHASRLSLSLSFLSVFPAVCLFSILSLARNEKRGRPFEEEKLEEKEWEISWVI